MTPPVNNMVFINLYISSVGSAQNEKMEWMKQEMLRVKPWHPIIQFCKYECKMVELGK